MKSTTAAATFYEQAAAGGGGSLFDWMSLPLPKKLIADESESMDSSAKSRFNVCVRKGSESFGGGAAKILANYVEQGSRGGGNFMVWGNC